MSGSRPPRWPTLWTSLPPGHSRSRPTWPKRTWRARTTTRTFGGDGTRAIGEAQAALARASTDPRILGDVASIEEAYGSQNAAVAHFAQSARLDPRNGQPLSSLAFLEIWRRQYDSARVALDEALALEPENLFFYDTRVDVALDHGDLAAARAALIAAPPSVDRTSLAVTIATFGDMGWALDSALERHLLASGLEAFGGDVANRAYVFAQQYAFRGDRARCRLYADSARLGFEAQGKTAPDDASHGQRHAFLGIALAYLGRKTEAIREGEHAVALVPIAKDAQYGPYNLHQLARIYTLVGEQDKAVDLLEQLLRTPYDLTPARLRLDPNFAALRGNPRFERLIAGS